MARYIFAALCNDERFEITAVNSVLPATHEFTLPILMTSDEIEELRVLTVRISYIIEMRYQLDLFRN